MYTADYGCGAAALLFETVMIELVRKPQIVFPCALCLLLLNIWTDCGSKKSHLIVNSIEFGW